MWDIVTKVSSGFALAAFLAAVAAMAYRRWLQQKERLIRLAPEAKRAALIDKTLEVFNVDPAGLSQKQRYEVVSRQIAARLVRFRITAAGADDYQAIAEGNLRRAESLLAARRGSAG